MWTEIVFSIATVLGVFTLIGIFLFCMLVQFVKLTT